MHKQKLADLNLTSAEMEQLNNCVSWVKVFDDQGENGKIFVLEMGDSDRNGLLEKLSYLDRKNALPERRNGTKEWHWLTKGEVSEHCLVIDETDFRTLQDFLGEHTEREVRERWANR